MVIRSIRFKERAMEEMRGSDALAIGFIQAFCYTPWHLKVRFYNSRGGYFKGLDRKLAAKYSFLLSIPVIGGATLLEGVGLIKNGMGEIESIELILGTLASMVAGYFAIKLLLKVIDNERLSFFAYYCWIIGFLTIIFG